MNKKYSAWEIAAAIMLIEGASWHYKTLTNRVIKSGLSILGGETPPQTLGKVMREDYARIFLKSDHSRGYYEMNDLQYALKQPGVRSAIKALLPTYFAEYQELTIRILDARLAGKGLCTEHEKRINELEACFHRLLSDAKDILESKQRS